MIHELAIPKFLDRKANPTPPATDEERRAWLERCKPIQTAAEVKAEETASEALKRDEEIREQRKRNRLAKLKSRTYQPQRDLSGIPEKFREWNPRLGRFVDSRIHLAARKEKALKELSDYQRRTEDMQKKTLQERIDEYNELATAAGKPTRKWFPNTLAVTEAIAALSPQPPQLASTKEDSTVPNSKKASKPRASKMAAGQLAKAQKDFRPVRAGTTRARVLAEMNGHSTVPEIAKKLKLDPKQVMAHAYCTWRDCGIGYEMRGDKIKALYPTGVTLKSAVVEKGQ